jgi:hypothetical protein
MSLGVRPRYDVRRPSGRELGDMFGGAVVWLARPETLLADRDVVAAVADRIFRQDPDPPCRSAHSSPCARDVNTPEANGAPSP